ncbi:uncharacterized protein LOC116114735 isoform X2 [Pistacia vera]|uniref:uncharacterized protein LOC116114735 isoform X2 n=1 Tax=Pistacia vera TaxID=55513 RepID=UPI00126325ED|nr:uncharacterized protein LOC116114735 isoform X2 [Pistacia vera]
MIFSISTTLARNLYLRHSNPSPFLKFEVPSFSIKRSLFLPSNAPLQKLNNARTRIHYRTIVSCSPERVSPAKTLRQILELPGVHLGPACFDALSAKLVQNAGFLFAFTSGYSISAARLALPDTGFLSYGEMVDQGQQITQAVTIPVIGDGDNGYGNAMNVKRTIKGFIKAGFAGIILEDQVSPKACGHTRGRKVVPRDEAVMHIKAAVDARKESGSDIVIVARTDSRQAVSLEEALWRSRAFADAGADVLFIDALASKEEMKAFCEISPLVPKMANMLEGGGKTPILNPLELEEVGFKLVVYPLSLIGVSIRAMQDALAAIKGGRIPPPGSMPSFEELKELLGFNAYYEEEKRYATSRLAASEKDGPRSPFNGIWSRTLRIKITGGDGFERLDVRIPAGFLEGITKIVPALGGVNLKELLDDAADEVGGKLLLDFNDTMGDRIQVFLE